MVNVAGSENFQRVGNSKGLVGAGLPTYRFHTIALCGNCMLVDDPTRAYYTWSVPSMHMHSLSSIETHIHDLESRLCASQPSASIIWSIDQLGMSVISTIEPLVDLTLVCATKSGLGLSNDGLTHPSHTCRVSQVECTTQNVP